MKLHLSQSYGSCR